MELNDRLCAVEEDYNRVSANNDEMMTKFDRERVITGEVSHVYSEMERNVTICVSFLAHLNKVHWELLYYPRH